jgi:hypothetical protein
MSRLYVEAWAPEYGSPLETDDELADASRVDTSVEVDAPWSPRLGEDDGVPVVAFVDGVRRVDARLTLDDPDDGPVPGICGSYGVGAVLWHRAGPRSELRDLLVDRLAVLTGGHDAEVPTTTPQLRYRSESVADDDPAALIRSFHGAMRKAEAILAEELAQAGYFVVADGPINDLSATDKVGYIKTHRVPYLPPPQRGIVGELDAGTRTPLFTIGDYRRYSWYVRLAPRNGGHSWHGVVRCEASAQLPMDRAILLADRTAALLPRFASEAHVDPRAPQNLVPIAALERELRRRLGEPGFVHRHLLSAVAAVPRSPEVVA